MTGKTSQKECMACSCADNSVRYSDWWYCNNPKNFRDFTILRWNCTKPEWCPKRDTSELLDGVKKQIVALERQKKTQPGYYAMYSIEQHKLFIRIEKELEEKCQST